MRALAGLLAASCWAAASVAAAQSACNPTPCAASTPVEIVFNFSVIPTGQGGEGWPPNVWSGTGPMPTTLQETFFVDPASVTGSYSPEPANGGGSVIGHLQESFAASNITLTANGQTLFQSASGTFDLFGDRAAAYGPSGSFFGGVGLPVGGGGSDFGSAFAQAPADWTAFLSTSYYGTDTSLFTVSGSFGQLDVFPQGHGVAVSVPEPGVLPLCALAAVGLWVLHRRPRPRSGVAPRAQALAGSSRARP